MKTHGQGYGTHRGTRRAGAALALAIVAVCGVDRGLAHAQDGASARSQNERQNDMQERRNRQRMIDREREIAQARQQNQRAAQERRDAEEADGIGDDRDGEAGGAGGAGSVGSLVGEDGLVSINFAGPVEISAFLEYVSRALGLTVRTVSIPSASVTFYAPVEIPADRLLPLTQSILEDNNLTMIFDEVTNTYVVKPAGAIPVSTLTTRVFPTPLLSPSALQAVIAQQLGAAGGSNNARFTPLDDLGVLMVTASTRTLDAIGKLLADLTDLNEAVTLHTFEVEQVSATYARDRILVLAGDGVLGGGGGAARVNVPRVQNAQQGVASGPSGSFSNLQSRLFIGNGNTLILRGTEEEARMLRGLVENVDAVRALRVKRYIIGTAAAQVAQSGQELGLGPVVEISVGATGSRGTLGGTGFGRGSAGVSDDSAGTPSASQFVLDVETGSFIYYGTDPQHDRVQEIVDEFKKTDLGDTIEIRLYPLQFASVVPPEGIEGDGVVDILTALIESPQNRGTNTSPFLPGGRGASAGGLGTITQAELAALTATNPEGVEGLGEALGAGLGADAGAAGVADGTRLIATTENTTIVADEVRNQIIIKAPAKAQRQFESIIAKLDKRQQQVYLDVKIVSVLANETFDFAADVQFSSGQFSFLSSFGLTSAAAGGDPFAPRTVGQGNAGVTSAIIRSDFVPIAINALETIGTTRTLSNPRLLSNDNQEATYSSRSEVGIAQTVQGNTSTVTSQGSTAEAGTEITVTPRISSGGYITLEGLNVELSSFTGDAVGNLQPPRQEDAYNATVTLPTDSTIVVGGFQLDIQSETERKVPVLGEIPLLGLLFSDIGEQKNTTTVFIFITPRIISDTRSSDMRLLTEGPMREMGVDSDVPDLEFVSVPIRGSLPVDRLLPRNEASDDVLSGAGGAE